MTALNLVSIFLVAVMVPATLARGGIASCCRKTSDTEVHRDLLTKYYTQRPPSCPLHAVVFITLQSKRICADPYKLWTQTSMAYLEGKNCHPRQLSKQRKQTIS
ncbi:monocyte chemotactic protein 1B-like [Phyllopteryx taeniolatus]|uniref:monocyte chemotactic protein 1B-like n=1 Tax=Phyllopteryx taeniolatus TaxID=161469 RepID=UPI002AD54D06|nr:monocyte chemotactic protein 1B-like [Phyllopteryx taeniolatus]